ncbi:MAG TPA: N-acetyl sugar amidotransferase [Hyphomonas sp.]|nr:N-acetyl sugar amidotransferase [Hyphomonas sp.]
MSSPPRNLSIPGNLNVCVRTVMDTTDPDIRFDAEGICHYWHDFQAFKKSMPSPHERAQLLAERVHRIRLSGRGRDHDCVLGLSGGVDSSWLAKLANELGLRPLVVHFDNGWNSELAVSNIENIVRRFGFDLETWVMDWAEFRDLQRAYLKASVLDLEVPTDHMIVGALYRTAAKHGIRTILSGTNFATEWLLPKAWNYNKSDLVNLKSIHAAFGERPLKTLPALGVWQQSWYAKRHGIRTEALLDLVDYRPSEARAKLKEELGWRSYGDKHHESIFTRFYQGHILPRKFGIDKRKAHFSNLILTGEMNREEALQLLQLPHYDEDEQMRDKAYVAKKLGFSSNEFDELLTQPNRTHEEFGTDKAERSRITRIVNWRRKLLTRP